MKPINVAILVIICIIAVAGSYLMIESVLNSSASEYIAAGIVLCMAGVFAWTEDQVRSKNG